MLTHAFTCTGPYAVLIATGIKTVENRSVMPEPSKGRCAFGCAKSFCEAEFGRFIEWASRNLPPEDFKLIPSWADVCDWPGKIIGACEYEVKRKSEKVKRKSEKVKRKSEKGKGEAWDEGYAYWWELSDVTVFELPIACRRNVGMWEMPPELAAKVSAADERPPTSLRGRHQWWG